MQSRDLLPNQGLDAGALSFGAAFLAEIQQAAGLADVQRLLEAAAREMGFRHYATIHHDDHRAASPGLINMNNYPPDYAAAYFGGLYHRDDPVVHAASSAAARARSAPPACNPVNANARSSPPRAKATPTSPPSSA